MAAPRAWLTMQRAKVEMMADLKSIFGDENQGSIGLFVRDVSRVWV